MIATRPLSRSSKRPSEWTISLHALTSSPLTTFSRKVEGVG